MGEIDINVTTKGVGHTWAVIKCDHATAKISFGPATPDDIKTIFARVPSTNDYHTGMATVTHAIRLNEAECLSMIEQVKKEQGTEYRLLLHNCTTAVLEILKAGHVNIYANDGGLWEYLSMTFATPASLAAELKSLNDAEAKEKENKVQERMRWRCNWRNFLHLVPSECAHPELGGEWVVLQGSS